MINKISIFFLLSIIIVFILIQKDDKKDYVGVHYIFDIDNVEPKLIYNNKMLTEICENCLRHTQVNILNRASHDFKPHGLTLLYLLSESHFSLHSWPEKGKLRIDFFSCQNHEKCEIGSLYLQKAFKNANMRIKKLFR